MKYVICVGQSHNKVRNNQNYLCKDLKIWQLNKKDDYIFLNIYFLIFYFQRILQEESAILKRENDQLHKNMIDIVSKIMYLIILFIDFSRKIN